MATILDAQLLGYFNSLFVFLFVLVVSYAILTSIKILGDNAGLNAIIAVILAALFASSSYVSKTFQYATPWIVLILILILFLNLFVKFMGAEKTLNLGTNLSVMIIVLIIIIVIFVIAAGQAGKEKNAQLAAKGINATSNQVLTLPQKIGETLRHPAVLGLISVLLIATFAIMLLSHD